jgi:hypothetical protein
MTQSQLMQQVHHELGEEYRKEDLLFGVWNHSYGEVENILTPDRKSILKREKVRDKLNNPNGLKGAAVVAVGLASVGMLELLVGSELRQMITGMNFGEWTVLIGALGLDSALLVGATKLRKKMQDNLIHDISSRFDGFNTQQRNNLLKEGNEYGRNLIEAELTLGNIQGDWKEVEEGLKKVMGKVWVGDQDAYDQMEGLIEQDILKRRRGEIVFNSKTLARDGNDAAYILTVMDRLGIDHSLPWQNSGSNRY